MNPSPTRRQFLITSSLALGTTATMAAEPEPVIDVHQHPGFKGRSGDKLLAHQDMMGATMTFVLPAGTPVKRASTLDGAANGLAAGCSGTPSAYELAQRFPDKIRFFVNEVPDLPEARKNLEKYLKLGAIGIGEQKFNLAIDSKPMLELYAVARDFGVPVLMHFQHGKYNHGMERLGQILERFPEVTFIGHAQTFWGHIDRKHDPAEMYPKTKVTPGGLTDRFLTDYPNLYGDLSAGSGRNSLTRDEDHARGFLERHQDRLLFGSDCYDIWGRGPSCRGSALQGILRRLAPDHEALRKILHGNAQQLFQLG